MLDMKGMRFEKLVVIERIGTQNGQALWRCVCDCGKESNVIGQNLRYGRQKSCGCLDYERKTIHGATKNNKRTPEYTTWRAMKSRCYRKNDVEYDNYGGSGVTVCDRWIHSFENFLEDMGQKPSKKHTIDRIDGRGNYEPNNCRWSTGSAQIVNQRLRNDNTSGHKGISLDKKTSKWHAYLNIEGSKRINIGYFINIEDAINAREQAEFKYRNSQPS